LHLVGCLHRCTQGILFKSAYEIYALYVETSTFLKLQFHHPWYIRNMNFQIHTSKCVAGVSWYTPCIWQ